MKKVMLLMPALLLMLSKPCLATDKNNDELLSFISLTTPTVTQLKITSLLGAPSKVEESKKHTWWYYNKGTASLVISWNKTSALPEKFSFTSEPGAERTFDKNLSCQLRSGKTDICQALKILGTPRDMTIKATKQEMHYAFQDKVLRLFFRDRMLVDFCLY